MSNEQEDKRAGSRTYTLKFSNSRHDNEILLHPEATYRFANRELDEYQKTWENMKVPGEGIWRTRTRVTFSRVDQISGEPYTLSVYYIQNKSKEANET
jgi:hypothetical protein